MRLLLPLLLACTEPKPADTGSPDTGGGDDTAAPEVDLVGAMDVDALLAHLEALQAIADAQAGTRVSGSPGYDESAAYAEEQLEAAGYAVTRQAFTQRAWRALADPVLTWEGAPAVDPTGELRTMAYSAGGTATGLLVAVDVVVPVQGAANTSTSGCEAEDFADFPAGAIALVQRGTCYFDDKAGHALDAGAVAVIEFNEGQAGRREALEGTLGSDWAGTIPVVGTSYELGEALVEASRAGPVTATLTTEVSDEERETWNLLADLPGQTDELFVVGGHLDSVAAGPGINDNGSGAALVLELARQAAAGGLAPHSTLRFALWGAEEAGLVGSQRYVDALDAGAILDHVGNLNFDMVASPNGGVFVYDGDQANAPAGSADFAALFHGFFEAEGVDWAPTAFDGRSDYGPFIGVGIPAGGLFSGAEGTLDEGEAASWGGEAGAPYDACYHDACDTIDNIDPVLFLDMARAAAQATQTLALDPGLSRRDREPPAPVSPLPPAPHGFRAPALRR